MKKLLLFVTMAASLLFTQCKKEESVSSAGKTVRMTVTAGPGSKTDITENGAITWSDGDQLYVGDGSKYIGCLTLVGDGGSATGTFSGNVTLPTDTKDGEKSFGFFYLGSKNYTEGDDALQEGTSTQATVSFASQNIYNNNGKLENVSACHVGYGSATGTVINDVVTDINVMLVSKVALAHFSFTKDDAAYEGALTLSGDNIYNEMTVNFASAGFACTGTEGDISLTNTTSSEKYVMLVPTDETTGLQTVRFAGTGTDANVSGTATLADGILPNQFYRDEDGKPIAVTLEAPAPTAPTFTVDADGTKVDFAPGNLWYGKAGDDETAAFHFEANQWDYSVGEWDNSNEAYLWNTIHVSHFFWSNTTDWQTSGKEPYASSYSYSTRTTSDVFFTNDPSDATKPNKDFHVNGETGENKWRTLSKDEWVYLMDTRTASTINGTSNARYAEVKVNGVCGMMLFPDEFSWPLSPDKEPTTFNTFDSNWNGVDYGITDFAALEDAGCVFLPAAGYRNDESVYISSFGYYWSSMPNTKYVAYYLGFGGVYVYLTNVNNRYCGFAVRLVCAAE